MRAYSVSKFFMSGISLTGILFAILLPGHAFSILFEFDLNCPDSLRCFLLIDLFNPAPLPSNLLIGRKDRISDNLAKIPPPRH